MNRGARTSGKHFFLSTDESGGFYPVNFWSIELSFFGNNHKIWGETSSE
jgi:hypothetical protein